MISKRKPIPIVSECEFLIFLRKKKWYDIVHGLYKYIIHKPKRGLINNFKHPKNELNVPVFKRLI